MKDNLTIAPLVPLNPCSSGVTHALCLGEA